MRYRGRADENDVGRYERALEEASEGLRLNPDAGVAYSAMAQSLMCADRRQEARAVLERAAARKLEPPYGRYILYGIALLEGDTEAMQQQVDRVAGTPAVSQSRKQGRGN